MYITCIYKLGVSCRVGMRNWDCQLAIGLARFYCWGPIEAVTAVTDSF